MLIAVPKEVHSGEKRAPMIPRDIERLCQLGASLQVEAGLGQGIRIPDAEYQAAGARVCSDRRAMLGEADIVLRLRKPPAEEVGLLKSGAVHVSFLDPFNERELVDAMARAGVLAVSMEMIPRTTRAQKMDALSSQANLAGYCAVLLAADHLDQAFPMMMTAAGTISPARVFVIGVGVAGLQAIATAKRLGARVEAFDTRPVVAEQVQSLGAKFVEIDLGEVGQTEGGYARELTPEQIDRQRQAQAEVCRNSDVVITTAQVFGRAAPLLVTTEVLSGMRPGSVVVDMAAESGGNVEGSAPGEVKEVGGVKLVGAANLPGRVAVHASQVYSANLYNLLEEYWDKESKALALPADDEIVQGCLITRDGSIVNATIAAL